MVKSVYISSHGIKETQNGTRARARITQHSHRKSKMRAASRVRVSSIKRGKRISARLIRRGGIHEVLEPPPFLVKFFFVRASKSLEPPCSACTPSACSTQPARRSSGRRSAGCGHLASLETRELDLPFFDLLYRIANCTIFCTPRLYTFCTLWTSLDAPQKTLFGARPRLSARVAKRPPSRGAKSAL